MSQDLNKIINRNGMTLAALLNALVAKGVLTKEEMQVSYDAEIKKYNEAIEELNKKPNLTLVKKPELVTPLMGTR